MNGGYTALSISDSRSPRELSGARRGNARPNASIVDTTLDDVKVMPKSAGAEGDSAVSRVLGIVQFMQPVSYVLEDAKEIDIPVMRIGGFDSRCSVSYHTQDSSAKAGRLYEASSGVVTFLPKEHTKFIRVHILHDDIWTPCSEFRIRLDEAENCKLDAVQYQTRIKIIDDDFFPANKFEEEFRRGRGDDVNGVSLLSSYLLFNLQCPVVTWRCIVVLLLDQLHNAYFLMTTYIQIYMIDVVFKSEGGESDEDGERRLLQFGLAGLRVLRRLAIEGEDGEESEGAEGEEELFAGYHLPNDSKRDAAYVCAALYVLPLFILHITDNIRVKLNLDGMSRELLQTSLFRKYLNYSNIAQRNTPSVSISVGVITECAELAEIGFMKALSMVRVFFKMLIVANFVHMEQPSAVLPMLFLAFVTLLWVAMWLRYLIKSAVHIVEEEKAVMAVVENTASCYQLVQDYGNQMHSVEVFTSTVQHLTKKKNIQELALLNSRYFFTWISTLSAGAYIISGSDKLLEGSLSLGTFLAMLRIIFELGEEFMEVFNEVIEVMCTIGPLRVLIGYLNGSTDLTINMQETRKCFDETRRYASQQLQNGKSQLDWDRIPITLENVKFQYGRHKPGEYLPDFLISLDSKLVVPQGSLVALIGSHQSGKNTLMQLLGSVLHFDEGFYFLPPHLRLLHVPQSPMILHRGLIENLTYGVFDAESSDSVGHERLRRIAKLVEFDSHLTEVIEQEIGGSPDKNWHLKLSSSQTMAISLARALITSPDILVVHRPTSMFNKDFQLKTMMILRQFVQNRGVECAGPLTDRRPRTCFYSSDRLKDHDFADQIWEVSGGAVRQRKPEPKSTTALPSLKQRN